MDDDRWRIWSYEVGRCVLYIAALVCILYMGLWLGVDATTFWRYSDVLVVVLATAWMLLLVTGGLDRATWRGLKALVGVSVCFLTASWFYMFGSFALLSLDVTRGANALLASSLTMGVLGSACLSTYWCLIALQGCHDIIKNVANRRVRATRVRARKNARAALPSEGARCRRFRE